MDSDVNLVVDFLCSSLNAGRCLLASGTHLCVCMPCAKNSRCFPKYGGVKITPVWFWCLVGSCSSCLSTEAVQGASLALEGVDHVEGGHGLAAGMLGVGHGVTDHVLKEHLEHAPGLLVDEATDTLDATTASQTPDGGLGDTWE
jgi:hypothetical protein